MNPDALVSLLYLISFNSFYNQPPLYFHILAGCPCPGYDCDSVATTTSSAISTTSAPVQQFDTILILNQNREENVPLLYTIGGELKTVNFNLKIV